MEELEAFMPDQEQGEVTRNGPDGGRTGLMEDRLPPSACPNMTILETSPPEVIMVTWDHQCATLIR